MESELEMLEQLQRNLQFAVKINESMKSSKTFDVDEDTYEEDIEDIEKQLKSSRVKRKTTSSKVKKDKTSPYKRVENTTTKKIVDDLPAWKYGTLNKSETIKVILPKHDIPYKEQRWLIKEREVKYEIELVTKQKENINCFDALHNNVAKYEKALREGKIRYYKIVTYEAIPSDTKELGLIEVKPNGEYSIEFKPNILHKRGINETELRRKVDEAAKKLIITNTEKIK